MPPPTLTVDIVDKTVVVLCLRNFTVTVVVPALRSIADPVLSSVKVSIMSGFELPFYIFFSVFHVLITFWSIAYGALEFR